MDLGKLLKARKQILEGITNTVFKRKYVEHIALHRNTFCNKCEHKGDKCEVPGTGPCCNICGCVLKFKIRALSSECPLATPLWAAVMTEEEEDSLRETIGYDH